MSSYFPVTSNITWLLFFLSCWGLNPWSQASQVNIPPLGSTPWSSSYFLSAFMSFQGAVTDDSCICTGEMNKLFFPLWFCAFSLPPPFPSPHTHPLLPQSGWPLQPRLSWNWWWSFCLSLLGTVITDTSHDTQLLEELVFILANLALLVFKWSTACTWQWMENMEKVDARLMQTK